MTNGLTKSNRPGQYLGSDHYVTSYSTLLHFMTEVLDTHLDVDKDDGRLGSRHMNHSRAPLISFSPTV
jgi:hypothetical protein